MKFFTNCALLLPHSARFGASLGLVVLGAALMMQSFLHLTPCPLCILQRYCLIVMTLLCFASGFTPRRVSKGCLALAVAAAVAGAVFAARQVYLQALPLSLETACGPGFEYIVNSFPLTDMLPMLFKGTGDCAQIDWIWHGITVPKLSLMAFMGFTGLLGLSFWKSR
jgi:disulfide bond formation protein DsbB